MSHQEVKHVAFSIDAESGAGDDGFTVKFFQFFSDIVESNMVKVVRSFFNSGEILRSFNHTQICLIPKVNDAREHDSSKAN